MKTLALLVIAAVALGLGVNQRAKAREIQAESNFPPEGLFIDVGGVKVHAVVEGTGPDLVLIHGASGNTRDFTFGLTEKLRDRFRVIVFDRPGLGYTERLEDSDESIAAQAALLSAAARQIGAERPIVLGQSYGGAVALAWGLNHPENAAALVLLASPSQPWNGEVPTLYRINSSTAGGALFVPLITAFVSRSYVREQIESIFAPQDVPEGYTDHIGAPLTLRRHSLRANAEQRSSLLEEIRAQQPRYPELAMPIEMVHGTADDTVPVDIHSDPFVKQVPHANLVLLDGVGHVPHHTNTGDVIAAIDRAAERAGLR